MTTPIVEITTAPAPALVITVPGPQGPPGVNNVHVGPTPPDNPEPNTVWIQTNG